MKITSVIYNQKEKVVVVTTEETGDMGFCFDMDDLTSKEDLVEKVTARVNAFSAIRDSISDGAKKFVDLELDSLSPS